MEILYLLTRSIPILKYVCGFDVVLLATEYKILGILNIILNFEFYTFFLFLN